LTVAATQASLDPKAKLEDPETWKGSCSSRCYVAKTDRKRCKCKFKGEHHGKSQQRKREEKAIDEFFEK